MKTIHFKATTVAVPIDVAAQIAELKRELAMRKQVYPKQISSGQLTSGTANKQYKTMKAVLTTLMALEAARQGTQQQIQM